MKIVVLMVSGDTDEWEADDVRFRPEGLQILSKTEKPMTENLIDGFGHIVAQLDGVPGERYQVDALYATGMWIRVEFVD